MKPALHRRRGHSLLEMLAVISVMTVLMSVVAVALTSLMRLGHESGEQLAWQATWQRLSLDFRDDARAATSASLDDDAREAHSQPMSLTMSPDATIEYRTTTAGIERLEQRNGATVASETYRLPEVYAAKLTLTGAAPQHTAMISLSRQSLGGAGPNAAMTQPLHIAVYVGRDDQLRELVAAEGQP